MEYVVLSICASFVIFVWVYFWPKKTSFITDTTESYIKANLVVSGMMCTGCAANISKTLGGIDGVKNINVSFPASLASFDYDPSKISPTDIVSQIKKTGYEATDSLGGGQALKEARNKKLLDLTRTKKRLIWALLPSVSVFVLSMSMMYWNAPYWLFWVILGLAILVIAVAGWHFFVDAWKSALSRQTNMSTLVSMGVLSSIVFSIMALLLPQLEGGALYADGAVMIVMLVSLGHYLRTRSELEAMKDVFDVASLMPDIAHLVDGDEVVDVPSETLKSGDIVQIRVGERAPADGVVISGASEFNNANITGESIPVPVADGDTIYAGSVNGFGSVNVRCEKVAKDTVVSRVIDMIATALSSKPKISEQVDRIASFFVPISVTAAVASFAYWYMVGNPSVAITTSITVLVISCPCALGLATPTALSVAFGMASRNGILVKNAQAFEKIDMVKTFVFDKTGTLTVGKPTVKNVVSCDVSEDELLELTLSAESGSEHVLAGAIREFSKEKNIKLRESKDFKALPGLGVSAVVDGHIIHIGSLRLLEKLGIDLSLKLAESFKPDEAVFFVIRDNKIIGGFGLVDPIKDNSKEVISFLKSRGILTVLLSGDRREVCEEVATDLGIDVVYSQVLPEEKVETVKALRSNGFTAMMGDGINDAAALAAADVSVAPKTGTGLALDVAEITLLSDDIKTIKTIIKLSSATRKNITWSLFWAFAYNALAIPVAAGVLYGFGILLNPMIASAAMAASSVTVVLNALRLKFLKLN